MIRMVFRWNSEYESYMNKNFPKNEGLYSRLDSRQMDVIKNYFRMRTTNLFEQAYKSNKLVISQAKAKKLVEITNGEKDWIFDGIVDLGSKCGKCTLGHALRYEYHAYSPRLRKEILFGCSCASDFFDIAPEMLKQMENIRKSTFEEVKKSLFVLYTGRTAEFKGLNYEDINQFMATYEERFRGFAGPSFGIMKRFLATGIPLTQYFIDMIDRFKKMEQRNKQLLSIIGGLSEREKAYVMRCMNDPETFKPYKFIHKEFGISIANAKEGKEISKETLSEMVKTGMRLESMGDVIKKKVASVFKADEYKEYSTGWFVSGANGEVPAYQNQISNRVAGLRQRYLCMLPPGLWEGISAIMWCCKGNVERLRAALPEARAKTYFKSNMYSYTKLLQTVNKTLDAISKNDFDLRKEIEDYKEVKNNIHLINNTVNKDIKEEVDEELAKAWGYLKGHEGEINYYIAKDIVAKYNDYKRLSPKQGEVIKNTYRKMMEAKVVRHNEAVSNTESIEDEHKSAEAPKPVEEKSSRELRDTAEKTRLFVYVDTNNKRGALIVANDACRPQDAEKVIPSQPADALGILEGISENVEVVYVNAISRIFLADITLEYLKQYNKELFKSGNMRCLDELTGVMSVDEIIKAQGFSEEDRIKYTKNVFRKEGVLDKFLKDAASVFIEYRRRVRQGKTVVK